MDLEDVPKKYVTIYGPPNSGKTSLIDRLCENKFLDDYVPSDDDEKGYIRLTLGKEHIKYEINFLAKKFSFYDDNFDNFDKSQVDAIMVMFDLSDDKSYFKAIKIIRSLFSKHPVPLLLIGNKRDIKKAENERNLDKICEKYNLDYYEVSLKFNEGIHTVMRRVGMIFGEEKAEL